MQYFVASLLTLLSLANSLQYAEANGGHNTWHSGPRFKLEVYPRIEEWPHGPAKNLILHKMNEPFNMTCTVVNLNGEKDDNILFEYVVDWKDPHNVNENPKIKRGQSRNTAWIWFERLAQKDAGDYTCMAVSQKHQWAYQPTLSVTVYLFVEHKPTFCGPQWFKCHSKNCIMERYVCDGKQDCEEGEDESPDAGCGLNPCLGKVFCEDRCIPPEWCCDHRNCSGTFGLRPWPHENHEISYVQKAFYTVIGCAMAFMFIVTILVIAICRVQIKRAMNSRCSQPSRPTVCRRRTLPLYDLDVYLNRTADVNYPRGVSIMYNINSGIQFVGRPAEPPPYSEVIAEPPREGPPPPYVSCENLIVRVPNPRFLEGTEISSSDDDVAMNAPVTRNIADESGPNPSDTDIRNVANATPRESSIANVPGPQVPYYSLLPRGGVIITQATETPSYSRMSRDSVDASATPSEASRVQVSNFELEYVETDALLSENNETRRAPKETTWRPYTRHSLAKSRWLNEQRDKRPEKSWYRQSQEKTIKECPVRERSSHGDSANEGIFLDTDQQDTTPTEDSGRNEIANAFPTVTNAVPTPSLRLENETASCSQTVPNEASVSKTSTVANDQKERDPSDRRDSLVAESKNKRKEVQSVDNKKHENDRSGKKTSKSVSSSTKRQSSLTSEEPKSKSSNKTSACASTVDLSSSRIDNDEANSQIRQPSLVLPLRESFIGVQRDS